MSECNHEFELDDPNDPESGICLGCGLSQKAINSGESEEEQEDE